MTTTTMYAYEARLTNGSWSAAAAGQQDRSNYIATREQAEAGLPALAATLECPISDVRVIELAVDVPPKAKRPAGRPPVTGVTRSTPILVRLTPDERAHMQRAADAAGQPLAAWVRDVAVRAAR